MYSFCEDNPLAGCWNSFMLLKSCHETYRWLLNSPSLLKDLLQLTPFHS